MLIKNSKQTRNRGKPSQPDKMNLWECTGNLIFNDEKLFLPMIMSKMNMFAFTLSIQTCLEVLTCAIREERQMKSTQTGKEKSKTVHSQTTQFIFD